MNKKETKYFSTAALVNSLQLLLCFIIYVIGIFLNTNIFIITAVAFIAECAIWLICGFKIAVSGKMTSISNLIFADILALLPIFAISAILFLINILTAKESQSWSQFFFLGGPLLFFNKPIALFMSLFKEHGYLLFLANYIVMFSTFFIGEFFGYVINTPKRKKEKRDRKEKEKQAKNKQVKSKKNKKKKKKKNNKEIKEDIIEEVNKEEEKKEIEEKAEKIINETIKEEKNDNEKIDIIEKATDRKAENIVDSIIEESLK